MEVPVYDRMGRRKILTTEGGYQRIVNPSQLEAANELNSLAWNLMPLIGVAGMAFYVIGRFEQPTDPDRIMKNR